MLSIVLILTFLFIFLKPSIAFDGASTGLLLWFHTVLPTLFPFFILNSLFKNSGTMFYLSKLVSPFLSPLFRISNCSSYAVLCGWLCGTPVGAKIAADLVQSQKISEEEGEYLLSFCNQTSPGFVLSFVFSKCLHRPDLAVWSLFLLLFSSFLCSMIFRRLMYSDFRANEYFSSGIHSASFATGLDESISDAAESLVKIGGYIMTFCVILFLLQTLPISHFVWDSIILPSLEITNGIELLSAQTGSFQQKYVLCMGLLSFGGWCAAFQTKCMTAKTNFSFSRYIKEKLITAMVTSFISYIFIFFNSQILE